MKNESVAIVLYGDSSSTRNALTDDGFKPLADALSDAGFSVHSLLYHDSTAEQFYSSLLGHSAALIWVDPIMQGFDRRNHMDPLLVKAADQGVLIATHPSIIGTIGTKEVLYTTRNMAWGGDTDIYREYEDFAARFISSMGAGDIRVIKQHRGASGSGIYKVRFADYERQLLGVTHARAADQERILSADDFHLEFKAFFSDDAPLLNQRWADTITNGMVRCYMTGGKVGGFGYQESIALCPHPADPQAIRPTSRRFYFSEDCGLFQDLRRIMEVDWIPQLQQLHGIADNMMPLLWDADFFIDEVNANEAERKYTLCEINVSCVSPFPVSCVPYMVSELKGRL